MKLLTKWLLYGVALLAVASICNSVEIRDFTAALWAALWIGLFNTVLHAYPGSAGAAGGGTDAGLVPVCHQRPDVLGGGLPRRFSGGRVWRGLLGSLLYSALGW